MKKIVNSQVPIIIPCEDEIVHTKVHPFCQDMTCPCHEDQELIDELNIRIQRGMLTQTEAERLYRGGQT